MESYALASQTPKFGFMLDEEVVGLAKSGHHGATECLLSRYRPLVETKAKAYFVMGADREDVIQEGMIGLCKAIRDYQVDRLNKFRPFAELCVTRQIITAVKTATRYKHVPLNGYISISRTITMESTGPTVSPSNSINNTATIPSHIEELVHENLSDLEKGVLRCYLEGLSYREMSSELACHTKAIDNALQRARRKIGVLLKD